MLCRPQQDGHLGTVCAVLAQTQMLPTTAANVLLQQPPSMTHCSRTIYLLDRRRVTLTHSTLALKMLCTDTTYSPRIQDNLHTIQAQHVRRKRHGDQARPQMCWGSRRAHFLEVRVYHLLLQWPRVMTLGNPELAVAKQRSGASMKSGSSFASQRITQRLTQTPTHTRDTQPQIRHLLSANFPCHRLHLNKAAPRSCFASHIAQHAASEPNSRLCSTMCSCSGASFRGANSVCCPHHEGCVITSSWETYNSTLQVFKVAIPCKHMCVGNPSSAQCPLRAICSCARAILGSVVRCGDGRSAPHGNLQVLPKLPAGFVQADAILLSLVTLHSPSRTLFSTSSDVNSARDIINNIQYVAEICIAGDACET